MEIRCGTSEAEHSHVSATCPSEWYSGSCTLTVMVGMLSRTDRAPQLSPKDSDVLRSAAQAWPIKRANACLESPTTTAGRSSTHCLMVRVHGDAERQDGLPQVLNTHWAQYRNGGH